MKKIMFNDKFGLTKAVLERRKTMTRRIIHLTDADMDYLNNAFDWDLRESVIIDRYAQYKVGEIVAVAQKYIDLCNCNAFYEALEKADPTFPLEGIRGEKGCYNKMFVKAKWMPNHIRITDIKVERLKDISSEDCLKEGIQNKSCFPLKPSFPYYFDGGKHKWDNSFSTPRKAFAALIDKVSGKGTWERNPWLFVYSFVLVE